jgi:hypothetical protein
MIHLTPNVKKRGVSILWIETWLFYFRYYLICKYNGMWLLEINSYTCSIFWIDWKTKIYEGKHSIKPLQLHARLTRRRERERGGSIQIGKKTLPWHGSRLCWSVWPMATRPMKRGERRVAAVQHTGKGCEQGDIASSIGGYRQWWRTKLRG